MKKGTKMLSIIFGVIGILTAAYFVLIYAGSTYAVDSGDLTQIADDFWGVWAIVTFMFSITLFFNRLRILSWTFGVLGLVCMSVLLVWVGPFTEMAISYVIFVLLGLINKCYRMRLLTH